MSFRRDREGVTAVLGTIMILGITVMGITSVMFWGAPTLQRIQEQNAQAAMLGEFQEIRRDSLVLSITDSSRVPRINLESGSFGLQEGTRMQVSAMWDTGGTCDFHVHSWGTGAGDHVAQATVTDCGTPTLNVYRVTGSNLAERLSSATNSGNEYTVTLDDTDADLTQGDWMFEVEESGSPVAQAWLISTNSIFWELKGASTVGLSLEGGAVFSSRDGTSFIQEQPPIDEEAFGSRDFVIRLPTYSGALTEHSGRTTPSLFLGLVGNHLRVSQDFVHTVRMDFLGENAEAWCNTLKGHDMALGGAYTETAGYECSQAGDGLRGVKYESRPGDLSPPQSCPAPAIDHGTKCTFPFEFIHARITTAL